MVHNAVAAFVERDVEKARSVIGSDDEVDALFDKVKTDVVATIQEDAGSASSLVAVLMVAKYLERIGDHAQNVAEWSDTPSQATTKRDLIGRSTISRMTSKSAILRSTPLPRPGMKRRVFPALRSCTRPSSARFPIFHPRCDASW